MAVDLLGIGKSGLFASKKSMQTTGHNIANANTEGYSRQRIRQETSNPVGSATTVMGTGVHVKDVKRVHDDLVEKRFISTLSGHKFNEERALQLTQLEDIFNEVDANGLNHVLNKFFNSFRELANQPENETVRSIVRENARLVVNDFKRGRSSLNLLAQNIDRKVQASVEDINVTLSTIAKLNVKINELETAHGETGDLRDQRDIAVKTLSEYFQVNVYNDEKGQYNVSAVGAGTLVCGSEIQELTTGYEPKNGNYEPSGNLEIFFKGRRNHPLTAELKDGTLGALYKTRTTELQAQREKLDELAHELTHTVNAIHRRGFSMQGGVVSLSGEVVEGQQLLNKLGVNFFKEPLDRFRAAEYIDLSDEVKSDLKNIATGLEPNQPGDNRIAIAISKLQHEKVLNEGTTSFEETYLKSMADVGLSTGKARVDSEQSAGILAQVKALKERISGVSLDEETSNMVRFQHAYEASARIMRAADEMFKTVLDMKR